MANEIRLHTLGLSQVTMVSNIFIDEYMADANGEYVKIYLYLLRALSADNVNFSVSDMADRLGHTQLDIKRALSYWSERDLLKLEYDSMQNLAGICLLQPEDAFRLQNETPASGAVIVPMPTSGSTAEQAPQNAIAFTSATQNTAGAPKMQSAQPARLDPNVIPTYTADELSDFQMNDEVGELLAVAEGFMKHPLSSNDVNTIIFWYDTLRLPVDVIEYLIEYCVESGHTSIRYMNKAAIDWAESGIETVEDAKRKNNIHAKAYFAVQKAFGIKNRDLIPAEQNFVEKWTRVYHLSTELLEEACRRTITNTGRVSFEYADSILTKWNENGVRTLADIETLDKKHTAVVAAQNNRQHKASQSANMPKNKFHNFNERQNDYDDIQRKLLLNDA